MNHSFFQGLTTRNVICKAWFPYDRYDRCDRCEKKKTSMIAAIMAIIWKTLSSDRSEPSDHMETRLKGAAKGGCM